MSFIAQKQKYDKNILKRSDHVSILLYLRTYSFISDCTPFVPYLYTVKYLAVRTNEVSLPLVMEHVVFDTSPFLLVCSIYFCEFVRKY